MTRPSAERASCCTTPHSSAVSRRRELTRIALDGQRRKVLLTAHGGVRFPDASPRNSAIAFALSDDEHTRDARWQVAVVDAAGGRLRVLADGYDPCFSPSATGAT